jgi:hypothetical protein
MTTSGSAEGFGEGSGEGSEEGTPYLMHFKAGDFGVGSAADDNKAPISQVGPEDSNGADRLSDGVTSMKNGSSVSSDYGGGSEGGGDSSSDSDPSSDGKETGGEMAKTKRRAVRQVP